MIQYINMQSSQYFSPKSSFLSVLLLLFSNIRKNDNNITNISPLLTCNRLANQSILLILFFIFISLILSYLLEDY